jgi:hypothetical protein
MGTTWKTHTHMGYTQNWQRGSVSQGLCIIPSPKEDRMDVLGVNKWKVWPASRLVLGETLGDNK